MARIVLTIILLLLLFGIVERDKLFVRDPLATVARNGVKEDGTQVFVTFHHDVLLENDNPPMSVELIQKDQPIGLPASLHCLHWLVCLTDTYPAALLDHHPGAAVVSMDEKAVVFTDTGNRETVVTLR